MLTCTVIAYFIFCALFLTLRYAVLPNIDHYKVDIERMASDAIGEPVSIATIHASWRGLRPHLILNNVVIYNKAGEQQLSLPKVSTTLSWWSAVVADLRLHTLEIDRPDVDIERDVQGNFVVAGILLDSHKKSNDGKGADWILSQREILIRDGRIRWKDAMRNAAELVLTDVDFTLHNQGRRHRFALNATPPPAFAAPIDVRADFDHPHFARKISDVTLWEGTLYVDWRNTDLAAWKGYFNYPIEVQKGKGSIRAWLTFDRARIADFTADLTLSDVSTRLHKDLQPLDLVQVNGRVSAREELGVEPKDGMFSFGEQGHAVALTEFSMEASNGLKLPKTTISQTFVPATKSRPEKNEVTATMLDLQTLADFVGHLPLSARQRQMLIDFAPRGQLKDFSAKWQGSYPDLSSYQIKGQFTGLAMNARAPAGPKSGEVPARAAVPGIPGFDNLTGRVDASDKGGAISLASDKAVLHLPGYFDDPIMPFDRLNMQAKWGSQDKNKLFVQIDSMDFVQDGVIGSLSGKHLMLPGGPTAKTPGTIDLTAKISVFDVKKIGRYLPSHTPDTLRNWLTGALQQGQAQDVAVVIKGDLANFPFRTDKPADKSKGQFTVSGKIDNGKLNYTPGHFAKDEKSPLWPLLEGIKGSFAVDRARLEIRADSASTHGVALSNVKAVIPDLLSADRLLDINGNAEGKLQDFVGFTSNSPVSDWIGHFTEETRASGNATLSLKLQLPLAQLPEAKVQGTLRFANNDVTLQNAMPPMLQANGELEFHEKGLNLNGIKASFLGGPIAASGGTQRDGSIAIKVDGSLSSDGLRKTYPMPAMQRLLQHITGSTRYSASIGVKKRHPEIVVESSLQGMALDFPAPLNKVAHERLPLKFEMAGLPSDDAAMVRDEVKLSLGSAITTRYVRQKSLQKNASWRVERGGIGVNVPAPQPDSGLIASVNLKSLDIDAWRNSVASIVGEKKPNEAATQSPTLGIAQYIEPEVLAARATELYIMGKKLDNVVVGASHQKGVWQANIDSAQASGYVTWNESPSGLGKATARLASLIIPQSVASDMTELLEGKNKSARIPGLDVVADNFELFGKRLGRLELVADNNFGPGGREWRIDKLSIANADAAFKATGKWVASAGGNVSDLTYALDIADAGKLLERFGFAHVLRGGKGKMEGDVSWEGLPFSIDIPSLSGQFRLNMAAGQFLKVDPGAAKLLSVLSLQSLPRRLTLDFRDIFSEGFAFDSIVGTATIEQGVMKTDNFKMRSVNAVVLLDGSADIAKESQNLRVVVIPEINAGAASLVYGLVVNPVVGLGSFLAQLFLRDPLMRAFTVEYDITGPWKDPVINKLARKFDNGTAASDIPPGAEAGR